MNRARVILCLCAMAAGGCTRTQDELPAVSSALLNPKGEFTLYVSNQSYAIDPVDITVEVDGETVVRQYFRVNQQHTWIPFVLLLSNGQHAFRAYSKRGDAEITRDLAVTGKHWLVINYWYSPPGESTDSSKHLSFDYQAVPPQFE